MAEQLKNAEQTKKVAQIEAPELSEEVKKEIAELTKTQRAAVLLLLLGEEQAANIIKYLNQKRSNLLVQQWLLYKIFLKRQLMWFWTILLLCLKNKPV